jgi:hypothetical protein
MEILHNIILFRTQHRTVRGRNWKYERWTGVAAAAAAAAALYVKLMNCYSVSRELRGRVSWYRTVRFGDRKICLTGKPIKAQWSLYIPHSGHYMYRSVVTICTAQWSLYVPLSGHYMYHQFNIHNSTFCPHTVFMCFVWISEQTAIISLYNINWLVFVTETQCVYCAVQNYSSCIIHFNSRVESLT